MEIRETVNEEILNFKDIVDASLNANFILDQNDHVVYVNRKCLEIFNVSKEEFVEKRLKYYLLPEYHEICRQRVSAAFSGQVAELMEQKARRSDGEVFHIEAMCSPLLTKAGVMVHVTIRDITNRKRAEHNLIQAEKLSMIGEVAAGIVHEIRNPLTTINGFLDLMKMQYQGSARYIEIMKDEVKRIEKIANDLLHLSKPKEESEFRSENIVGIIHDVIFLWETELFKRGIQLEFQPLSEQIKILCEKTQVQQVFINLLKNAIEACNQNGEISIHIEKNEANVRILIKDNGIGMPVDLIDNLGASFRTTKANGTGLGLMVTYNIIKQHQGTIEVISEEGKGTTFLITLPLDEAIENE